MPITPRYPGVYVQEISAFSTAITPAPTGIAAFVGRTPLGPVDQALTCFAFGDFERLYGGLAEAFPLTYAVRDFFLNGGTQAVIARLVQPGTSDAGSAALTSDTYLGDPDNGTGMYLLNGVEAFDLLCIPPDQRYQEDANAPDQDLPVAVRLAAAQYCTARRAVYIVDPPVAWEHHLTAGKLDAIRPEDLGIAGADATGIEITRNAAVYFPRVVAEDPLRRSAPALFPPCGMIAGIIAATDVSRGVWKSPAGTDAVLTGVARVAVSVDDTHDGALTALGINCLRSLPVVGPVVWGARTLRGADAYKDDFKYLSVRRLTLFIESSLSLGMRWAVFEANNEELWSSLRLSIGSFLAGLAQQGALYDYSVQCGLGSSMTGDDVLNGWVRVMVQIAAEAPANFIVISLQQTCATEAS